MAEYFKEPQNPLKKIDEKTGDITYVYPMTTAKQVIMDDDGTRLNTILTENILYLGESEDGVNIAPVDADTLGGIPASEYALKGQGGGGTATSGVKINLDGAIASGQPIAVDADTLGGVDASEYITRDELEEGNMDLLWENPDPSVEFGEQTLTINRKGLNNIRIISTCPEGRYYTHDVYCYNDIARVYLTKHYQTVNEVPIHIRIVNITNDQFHISDCMYCHVTGGQIQNYVLIPVAIYGIKDTSIVSGGGAGGGDITVNLNGAEQSGQPSTVNADLLGGIAADEYATTEYMDNELLKVVNEISLSNLFKSTLVAANGTAGTYSSGILAKDVNFMIGMLRSGNTNSYSVVGYTGYDTYNMCQNCSVVNGYISFTFTQEWGFAKVFYF